MTGQIIRYLGGESGHRSLFGGQQSRGRVVAIVVIAVAGVVMTPFVGWWAIVTAIAAVGVTLLLTARTHRGTAYERWRRSRRWRARTQEGVHRFTPFSTAGWDQLVAAARDAAGRRARRLAAQNLAAMRSHPDGFAAGGWLQFAPLQPGITWQQPGRQAFFTATFAVSGQLRGIETPSVMNRAAEGWGKFLANLAAPGNLATAVQTLTRVVPSDSALQESWVADELDPQAPADAIASYEEVLERTGGGAMIQRHYITITWPCSAEFRDAAAAYATSTRSHAIRDSWRALLADEIEAVQRGLEDARMGTVTVLTARQIVALMLHQQDPARPIDQVADVDPANTGVASYDEFSAHVVTTPTQHWWHRTAKITADAMATAPRTQLWLLELLIGKDLPFQRSVSFHLQLIPAAEAKSAAARDMIRDQADIASKTRAGVIELDETGAAMSASKRRRADLRAGSGHHGVAWCGYVTITATSRDHLARASRQLEETCANSLGISRLDWQDSYQAAASGTTWPIGRGLDPAPAGLTTRAARVLAGRRQKEAL